MPLLIEDKTTTELVVELADLKQTSQEEAVREAVCAELKRLHADLPLREKFARLRAQNPLPPPTGLPADKAFFDELSGDL